VDGDLFRPPLPKADVELVALKYEIEFDPVFDPMRTVGINYVGGFGNKHSPKIMFVGEAPGPMENVKLKPFVGGAGSVFRNLLKKFEIKDTDIFITNVCKYMPCHPNTLDFRKPTLDEIKAFRPYLLKEIDIVDPIVVCLLGNVPLQTYFNFEQKSVTKCHGIWTDEEPDPLVFVTFHPSSVQYDTTGEKLKIIEGDFKQLAERIYADN